MSHPMKKLERLMKKDAGYARAWKDNLACAIYDGVNEPGMRIISSVEANKAAVEIMWRFFNVKGGAS